ncbi:hypothetical protein [Paenibacillus agricola]|uniref:Uncharacterized protein n=1 Tax=Paenibacillus agricola TaxID=2716264 RepID=A0ABX0JEX5_9BACL|nr:hypothetical protein [Paenibacillus agricola]NHN33253.1 hypothetical protein [Paenibacillus agricola]
MRILKKETTSITKNVEVLISHRIDNQFDVAVKTNWFPNLSPDEWKLDESEVPAREGLSSMEVYGYIEYEVKVAYLTK